MGFTQERPRTTTVSTVLRSLSATTVRRSTWSRTVSKLSKEKSREKQKSQTWPGATKGKSKML